jgi:DNA-binding beta-propeller fold protein YncE
MAQEVDLGRWSGELSFMGNYSRVDSTSPSSDSLNESSLAQTRLSVRNSNGFLFDPSVMTFIFSGNLGFHRDETDATFTDDSSKTTTDGDLWGYSASVQILPGQALAADLFTDRSQTVTNREFSGRSEYLRSVRGIRIRANRLFIPSTLTFRQEVDEEVFRDSSGDNGRKERREILSYQGQRGWVDSELEINFEHVDMNDMLQPKLDFSWQRGNLRYLRSVGPNRAWEWVSNLRASSRDGFSEEDRLSLEERLTVPLGEQLSTHYRYYYRSIDTPSGDTKEQWGSAELTHGLYDNLTTSVTLQSALFQRPGGKQTVSSGGLVLNYRKRLPGAGSLQAGVSGRVSYEKNEFDSNETFVSGERHVFSSPFALAETLDQLFVIASTVTVRKVFNGPPVPGCGTFAVPGPLDEGVDYTLAEVGDTTEIVPIPCTLTTPGINAGDIIEVDYRYTISPDLEYSTVAWVFHAAVDYGWIRPYFQHEDSNQRLEEGKDGAFLRDRQTDKLGLHLRHEGDRVQARMVSEVERHVEEERKYESFLVTPSLRVTLGPRLQLNASASQNRITYSRPESRRTESWMARASMMYRVGPELSGELFFMAQELQDTLSTDERLLEAGAMIRWQLRKLQVSPSIKFLDRKRGDARIRNVEVIICHHDIRRPDEGGLFCLSASTPIPAPQWPAPPRDPVIRFVTEAGGPEDFGLRRSFWKRVAGALRGDGRQTFIRPTDVVVANDNLYVADPGIPALWILNRRTRRWQQLRTMAGVALVSPVGVAPGPAGSVFLADSRLARVFRVQEDGKMVGEISDADFRRPAGLRYDASSDRLYVADSAAHTVWILSSAGKRLGALGQRGSGNGQFNYPTHVTVDRDGNVHVTDAMGFRIQSFGADGRYLASFGRHGDDAGDLAAPKGVAVDRDGHVYVVDALFDAVQIFDREGRLLLGFGKRGAQPGQFWLPGGIFIDGGSQIYVADSYNQRIQVFEYFGGGRDE